MKKSPLQLVNAAHGSKDKLVDKLMGMVDRGEEDKEEFKARLLSMANSKLLRLHDAHEDLKKRFSDKEQLISAIMTLAGKAKDKDWGDKLATHTPVRLLAMHAEWEKRAKKAKQA